MYLFFSVTREVAAAFGGTARVLTSIVLPAYWLDASPTVRYRLVDEHRTNDWPRGNHSRAITERHSGWFLLRTGSTLLSFGFVRDLGALFS